MFALDQIIQTLGYNESPNYVALDKAVPLPANPFLFSVDDIRIKGVYFIRTAEAEQGHGLALRPVVYLAEARDITEAKELHKRLWNFSYAPFLIVILPNRIHIYSGFDYSEENDDGLLERLQEPSRALRLLRAFTAESVDTGEIWRSGFAHQLKPSNRVDRRLLRNLNQLGDLLKERGLREEVAHALIGKYVYFSYLRDRGVINSLFPAQTDLVSSVFSSVATIRDVRALTMLLENKLNGNIFYIDFDTEPSLDDLHISWVASVFSGDKPTSSAPQDIWQLHLPFRAYDFEYIPVETLSVIYEQFISNRKKKGVVYTPEVLADYLISEVGQYKKLSRGLKILDPACGSGIFLVLAYRRLIEQEIDSQGRWLHPRELTDILLESIYGVERELEACLVAEFSLLLTLLHYTRDLSLLGDNFHFPSLHNARIFHGDFFDVGESSLLKLNRLEKYDIIVGNPPWIELKPDMENEQFVRAWLNTPRNRLNCPVGGNRVAEVFSWEVLNLLASDGIVGLIMPATSLFNLESREYREAFFTKNMIFSVANFSNLRDIMFGRRGAMPAATIVYKPLVETGLDKPHILHYAPFSINQIVGLYSQPWIITINENEIQSIRPTEAETGDSVVWKIALWGSFIDRRTLERIQRLFPLSLEAMCSDYGWPFHQGPEFRSQDDKESESLNIIEGLETKKRLVSKMQRRSLRRLSVVKEALYNISREQAYLRRGREALSLTSAPHILISYVWMSYLFFSDVDFVIPVRHFGIASKENDTNHLRALALYLNSSIVAYYMFFYAQQWGVFRQARQVSLAEVRRIPTPQFSSLQVQQLAELYNELAEQETVQIEQFFLTLRRRPMDSITQDALVDSELAPADNDTADAVSDEYADLRPQERKMAKEFLLKLRRDQQILIDKKVYEILSVPQAIQCVVNEFFDVRLLLDRRSDAEQSTRMPTEAELVAYAKELLARLQAFGRGRYDNKVLVTYSSELIECVIEFRLSTSNTVNEGGELQVNRGDVTRRSLFRDLSRPLRQRISQWMYVQKGLRLFEGPKVYLYKMARLVDWTRTQAMSDAADLLSDVAFPENR